MIQQPTAFQDIKQTILALKANLNMALASVPVSGRSAPEIHRGLKIDRTMAWKISKLILVENVFQASTHMPGRAAITTLLKSLKKNGVDKERVVKIEELAAEYFKLVDIHAGDRASFDMMMLSMSEDGLKHAYQAQQKIQYSANSYLLGIQSKAHFTSWFYHPSEDMTLIDNVILRGIIDLERKRPKAPFVLTSIFHGDSEGNRVSNIKRIPLESEDETILGSHGFLSTFCTKPLPKVLDVQETDSKWVVQLADGPIGKTNAITLVSGDIYPKSQDKYPENDEKYFEVQTRIKTPTKAVVIDVLLHSSLIANSSDLISDMCQDFTEARVVSPITKRSPETKIPCYSSIKHVGNGLDVLASRHIPEYRAMVEKVYEKMEWNEKDMHLYRVVVEYPVTPSSIYIRIPTPDKQEN